jgi:hypothetical protein
VKKGGNGGDIVDVNRRRFNGAGRVEGEVSVG